MQRSMNVLESRVENLLEIRNRIGTRRTKCLESIAAKPCHLEVLKRASLRLWQLNFTKQKIFIISYVHELVVNWSSNILLRIEVHNELTLSIFSAHVSVSQLYEV